MHRLILLVFLLFIIPAIGQEIEETTDSINNNNSRVYNTVDPVKEALPYDGGNYYFLSHKEFWLALIVLVCLLILIAFEFWLIKSRNLSEDSIVRLIIITIVIMGTLFLIMAGYDDQIVAPAFALFGTIAGYLFGRSDKRVNDDKP